MSTLSPHLPPPRPPAWAVPLAAVEIDAVSAVFAAGAALATLDPLVRAEAPFAGAWRQRLALKAAGASAQGRAGEEAALRDALALTRAGGDPGPAGRAYDAWRALARDGPLRLPEIAAGFGAAPADLPALTSAFEAALRANAVAPLAAASAARAFFAAAPRAPALAFAVADAVLAARLGWRTPTPLLALEIGRARPDHPAWSALCAAAYARAAARACDLHAELARAAARLAEVAPKLRAKGAAGALAALLDADAVSAAMEIKGLSERGLRRLLDRLVALGAARELTGRPTFRLYGL